MLRLPLILAVMAACATPPSAWAVADDVAILVDDATTYAAQQHNPYSYETVNSFIGSRPSWGILAIDAGLKIAVVHLVDHMMPRRWWWQRAIPSVAWLLIEAYAISVNVQTATSPVY